MEAYIKVEPGSEEFSIDTSGDYPSISLTSSATQGKANRELVERLTRILDAEVGILSGHHSRRKKIVADVSREEFISCLEDYTD